MEIKHKNPNIYVFGAGLAGSMLAKEITDKKIFGTVKAFFDDDESKIGTYIHGFPVYGPIEYAIKKLTIMPNDEALIAIPSIQTKNLKRIFNLLKEIGFLNIKILPAVSQVIEGKAHLVQTRKINPQDLLAREPVTIDLQKSLAYLKGKRVLITGAGGSIGSELARQLLLGGVERLYLFGNGENSIYTIEKELRILQDGGVGVKTSIVPIIGDLKDRDFMHYLFSNLSCDVVFHAAAYKHVPLMEANPVAVIENNVLGTKNLTDACLNSRVKKFVLISTDKAVEPVSVYGMSKFLSEKIVNECAIKINQNENNSEIAYMVVRFGNVLGSRGSILPLFTEQILKGGPVTITDKNMTRFFMTIPEACSLVLKTGGVGYNGKSYLLDMGEPVKIIDVAEQLIRFMGYEPEKDIQIQYIGVRPGERLDEPLWAHYETPIQTKYPKILQLEQIRKNMKSTNETFDIDDFLKKLVPICSLNSLTPELYRNKNELFKLLEEVKHYEN